MSIEYPGPLGGQEIESGENITLKDRSPLVYGQLNAYFELQKNRYKDRGILDTEKLAWARNFTTAYLAERFDRADDLQSKKLAEARELSEIYIGKHTDHFIVTCLDGRIPLAVPMSHVPHVGGVMRTAAGDFEGFKDGMKSKTVIIDYSSYTAQIIRKMFESNNIKHYSLDSHIGCKARGDSELTAGSIAEDGGLAVDVKRKMNLARGIEEIRRQVMAENNHAAELYTQFFSYDPHDGSLTMGLEMHVDDVDERGFSAEVRDVLAAEGKIVTSWQFLKDTDVQELLAASVKQTDFRNHFPESMLSNWQAITKLYDNGEGFIYQKIYADLENAYCQSGWTIGEAHNFDARQIATKALENKARVMLKNVVTRWSIVQDKDGEHDWPFGEHKEHGVVFTEGGYGPFKSIDLFSIFSKGEIPNNTYTAIDIVRTLRRAGAIEDPLNIFTDPHKFFGAPVMVINKAIVRNISPESWNLSERLDMNAIFSTIDWDNQQVFSWGRDRIRWLVNHEGFKKLGKSPIDAIDHEVLVDGVYEVFDRMRRLMSDERLRPMLIHGSLMVCNLLVDQDRRARLVLPIVA